LALIKSISGIRGTIGGSVGDNLTAQDIVSSAAGYGAWLLQQTDNPKVIIGRDARISGEIVNTLVVSTLRMLGIHIIDLGLSTTPTVEIAVVEEQADGGIILTASHNPKEWNALKLLNNRGEFISAKDGQDILNMIHKGEINYASVDKLGTLEVKQGYMEKHVEQILQLPLVDQSAVKARGFKIVIDCINSTGSLILPILLRALGCEIVLLNADTSGNFAHNPEPLPKNLSSLCEEYTLVAIADYVLQHKVGNTVSNLSSTRALRDVTEKRGGVYHAAAVGEVNVVTKMKECNAIIGGEGNGGVIYPAYHYGRDAVVGIALFLSHLAAYGKPVSFLRSTYPSYTISKNKIQLTPEINIEVLLAKLQNKYQNYPLNTIDGLKIEFDKDWIHLRKSNTEPIIRIYTESNSETVATNLARKIQMDIQEILKG